MAERPKWEITDAISRGNQAFELASNNKNDLQKRLKPGQIEKLKNA